jgi:HD superfamily phosphohydrolase
LLPEHLNKRKIINDPVYGFISIGSELIFDLIEHPYFQRLRHIRQLGLTDLVYPGALHTRFHHALGAMHLMGCVLENLRNKGIEISAEEFEAAQAAILLHDIGHGPFSHALEETLLSEIKHESISYLFMKELNIYLDGKLDLTLKIFRNSYSRKFFHQLVSSQLDIDRLDYLKRDCFFTGVMEGSIGVDRIIAMLDVHNDQIVVQEKGIYSIENFLNARRLMYWQVYLHKTAVSAERMLVNIIRRAHYVVSSGEHLIMSDALRIFLTGKHTLHDFTENHSLLYAFGQLDDNDVWGAIKIWKNHSDPILSQLCTMLLQRNLFKITLTSDTIKKEQIEEVKSSIKKQYSLVGNDASYLFSAGTVSNAGYMIEGESINIITRKGKIMDITEASDLSNIMALSKIVKKNYLCWPKDLSL